MERDRGTDRNGFFASLTSLGQRVFSESPTLEDVERTKQAKERTIPAKWRKPITDK